MDLSKNFQHQEAAAKWYQHWEKNGYFKSIPDDRPAYTIVMPPPNVTGVLHMGHALNNSVQDVLIRRAKMKGFNTCWVPGTDHASIATEAKVVAMLREQGIDKNTLSRADFLTHAWAWKEKYGGIILEQLRQLGCALDWDRTHFTMDTDYYAAVIRVFNDLYERGYIYRGVKMINWDPKAQTALSDEEVIFKQTQSNLYHVRYKLDTPEEAYITIATVRPETILGDTAICVHPNDPRYAHLKGAHCFVPLINRKIPIIFDEYIDMEFGTGALKVTPAHDINDYNLGIKHKLPVIDTINADGTMSEAAQLFVGEDRFVVRKKIVAELEALGHLVKTEPYTNQVGYSERTDVVIEPRLSMQWWCKMDELVKPALEAVLSSDASIEFVPSKYKNLYRHWMENIKDWCISRQLWWGHRIPAWYLPDGTMVVAKNETELLAKIKESHPGLTINDLKQDEDCLDTWFSSWLWPMEVFGWNADEQNNELQYYYPTQTLVTAPEIIFFWVARMIMAGTNYKQAIPFEKVYFTGIVRDKLGRKMSKSLGNSPDLLALIDTFGTDAVRFSVLISSPAGNDLLYDEAMLEQGRNFCNKMWNALKLTKMWEAKLVDEPMDATNAFAIQWMEQQIIAARMVIDKYEEEFKLSETLKTIYSLIWDDFCSWYLEWVKPAVDKGFSKEAYAKTLTIYESLLQLLHPYLPFITEEIYHALNDRKLGDDLMVKQLAPINNTTVNEAIIEQGNQLKAVITAIRDARNKNNVKPKESIALYITSDNEAVYSAVTSLLAKQVNASSIEMTKQPVAGGISIVVGVDKLYVILNDTTIDTVAQKAQLEKDLQYYIGFLQSVEKKLSNEKFVQNAKPEVIAMEQKKQSDALAKIKTIEESLQLL
ncbi:MAG: valine--tRNA ligase [Bacteroidota bacterium]|nr:valine--tRNA ligase [Bacteroidota bacterium]